ncbi:MAG: aminoacyl-tRNA hydrolase [Flavobacteriaceae bacterium]|nr:aminoacyl-tRNA hydrolase [Flavobacteriaceae bacterium]
MKKYLIVGLGNIGEKYKDTRHNIGFKILNTIATKEEIIFSTQKLGDLTKFRFKGRTFILLKPNTYMNLSGKAVKYWMKKEKIPLENILIICDDLNIPFQKLRLKPKGSAGGHNGLKDINNSLCTQQYARMRFGVGHEFSKGRQAEYVLGKWSDEELKNIPLQINKIYETVKSFGTIGLERTMNIFNTK